MNKPLLFLFASLLVFTACQESTVEPEPAIETETETEFTEPQTMKEEENPSLEAGWEIHTDETLGLQFEYPSAWGPVIVHDEEGLERTYFEENSDVKFEDLPRDEDGELVYDGIYNRALVFSAFGEYKTFLVANNESIGIFGRGGFWGDRSAGFHSQEGVDSYCAEQDDCEYFTNENGVEIAHTFYSEIEVFDALYYNVDEYAIFHSGHTFSGIVISSEFLGEKANDELRQLVESLEFLD